ncbi:MAG TPA: histidine kinase [Micromonosporaceae bacterium]|nr:histidine kinase [Micromonosporaceae bacterium]
MRGVTGRLVRRPNRRDLRLPGVLGVLQLVAWPLVPWVANRQVAGAELLIVGIATAWSLVALSVRRVSPVPAWVAVGIGRVVLTVAGLDVETVVLAYGDLVVLYSVARYRTARVAVNCLTVTAVAGVIAELATRAGWLAVVLNGVLSVALLSMTVLFGRSRRHGGARQEAIAARLARAEDDERYAAAGERERLARELHDVAAHHLTAIVVNLGAAHRLGDRSPALVGQALGYAGTAGRQTVTSLRHLVSIADTPGDERTPDASLHGMTDLIAGFERLGLSVRYTVEGTSDVMPVDVEAAVYRIARESLTNALRYAGGGPVTVRVLRAVTEIRLFVDDAGPDCADSAFDLGSGSGIAGMKARAGEFGGEVHAGPRPGGGWSVRAVLPLRAMPVRTPAPVAGPADPVWNTRHRHVKLLDGLVAALAVALPLVAGLESMAEPSPSGGFVRTTPAAAALLCLVVLVHGGLLLWRRRCPWLVLAGMLGVATLGWALVRFDVLPWGGTEQLWMMAGAQFVAVYSVGAYAGPPALTWVSAAAVGVTGGAVAGVFALDDRSTPADQRLGFAIFGAALVMLTLIALLLPTWALGWRVRRTRSRRSARDAAMLHAATSRAVAAARGERVRLASGLREQVLGHTERLVAIAECGDPGQTESDRVAAAMARGRAALAAMRELLTVLRGGVRVGPRSPEPTLAGVLDLCRSADDASPTASLRVRGVQRPLPPEVELCSYRLVESVLPPGGTRDAGRPVVTVEYGDDDVRLIVADLATSPRAAVLAALRERVDAVGGALTTRGPAPNGWTVQARFPIAGVKPSIPG